MSVIRVKGTGSFKYTEKMLKNIENFNYVSLLSKYGEMGVKALMEATPVDTGKTAASWSYAIKKKDGNYSIEWLNSNLSEGDSGPPVVVLLYYGHVTRQGGYVEGRDFITPAMKPIFEQIANEAWKEMKGK